MSVEIIGKQIASMRKERGIKQEELATFVGVSTQAVSKWENGGVPDTDLLPKIAEFFSVSIDSLFGRDITDYSDLQSVLMEKIAETECEGRIWQVFEHCWDMERALMPIRNWVGKESVKEYEKGIEKNAQHYSSIATDHGFTRMGIANRLQYFLIVPETKDTDAAFFNGIDYTPLFRDFSDKDVFDACVMLNKREHTKAFTTFLIVKQLGVSEEKANEIIKVLLKYQLISSSQIEMDDEIKTIYHFRPTSSFVAFLIFARELIDKPDHFSYYSNDRTKPYFK